MSTDALFDEIDAVAPRTNQEIVLAAYRRMVPALGRMPRIAEVAAETGLDATQVKGCTTYLRAKGLLRRDGCGLFAPAGDESSAPPVKARLSAQNGTNERAVLLAYRRLASSLDGPPAFAEVAESSGLTHTQVKGCASQLAFKGLLESVGRGLYAPRVE